MSETANLQLPLVQPSQAQKHITVNEALARLDAVAMLRLTSIDIGVPPTAPVEGSAWAVPSDALAAWSGAGGRVALFLNGGWQFLAPRRGWRAFVIDRDCEAVWTGAAWQPSVVALSPGSARTTMSIREADVALSPGPTVTAALVIPANSVVIGVSARVVTDITGTLATWRLGVGADPGRFGAGLGRLAGSFALGLSGTPTAYYADTPLVLGAEGGLFAAGSLRVAIHLLQIAPPA